jgi:adenylyl cyclase-associated protein
MIYRRLEAATSRLEDMAASVDSSHPPTGTATSDSAVPHQHPSLTTAAAPSAEPLPPSIEDFDKILEQEVNAFVKASEKVGGLVEQQVWARALPYSEAVLIKLSRQRQRLKLLRPNGRIFS